MPGGRWKFHQTLNAVTGQVEWPNGPLNLKLNETAKWVEAWVVQRTDDRIPIQGIGASERTAQWGVFAPGNWKAEGIPPGWSRGDFHAGPALGIALAASEHSDPVTGNKSDAFFWWLDIVDLS
jgi:hypothetical protein